VLIAGIGVAGYAAWRGPLALRLFLLFSAITLAAGLLAPNLGPGEHLKPDFAAVAWERMLASSSGSRYFIVPVFAFLAALVWSMRPGNPRTVRTAAAVFLAAASVGIAADFRRPPYPNAGWHEKAAAFDAAPPGTRTEFPLDPPGWSMTLTK
jgi:hypothetical protein